MGKKPIDKEYKDLWVNHSDLLWSCFYKGPVIVIAIFTGWYVLVSDYHPCMARLLLFIGLLSMVGQALILCRITENLQQFRVKAHLPKTRKSKLTVCGHQIHGSHIAIGVTLSFGFIFLLMLFLPW